MVNREISERYAGQFLGVFWALFHPIFLISLYIFVFSVVFKLKVGGTVDMPLDYTTYLLSGIVAWLSIQEGLIKSPTIFVTNASLVKQTIFPKEVLIFKSILTCLIPQFVSLIVLITYVIFSHGSPPLTYFLLPVIVSVQFVAMCGIAFFLSSIATFVRDIKDFVQLFALSGIYLMPIFYLPDSVPSLFRPLLYLNPFSYIIWVYQDALYFGSFVHPFAWLVTLLMTIFCITFGYRIFQKLSPLFGNVL
jgi:lipopolysaccharide transport system permease protein|tara:strand:- start:68 stop:814 length:747 start_codon:yes stop_codon:yes gene_type:complete